ncbi:MAG: gliding motility-associated C-terminal domain-containing protein [Bacteroidota bacterium]
MKKYIISTGFLLAVLMINVNVMGQPDWSVNPADYQYTMTITGIGSFDCQATTNPNDQVAVFVGEECRGVASFSTDVDGQNLAYLTIYDGSPQGSELTFRLYDAENDLVIESPKTDVFSNDGILGNPDDPYEFLTEYEITSIYLPGDSILGSYQPGTSVSELFLINTIGDTLSGEFSFVEDSLGPDNDQFSLLTSFLILDSALVPALLDSLTIHIAGTNESGCATQGVFTLNVVNTNLPPVGLVVDSFQVNENQPIGTFIGSLEAEDESPDDAHTFSLIEDEENVNEDHSSFEIIGADLNTLMSLNYESQIWYALNFLITDEAGNSVVDTLWIEVLDEIEFENLKAGNLITPDNDGFNDRFTIPNVELFRNYELFVYNSWGAEVYSTSNYDNSWEGTANNGSKLPSGTYYYVFRDKDNEESSFEGEIHIYRNNKF